MKKKKLIITFLILLTSLPLFSSEVLYSYDDLISLMNVNNLELLKQDEVIKTAMLDVKDAKANYHPQISLSLSGTYMVNPPIDRITVSTDDLLGSYAQNLGIPNNYVTLYDGMENTLYMGLLTITQPIITWGKVTNAVKLYEKMVSVRTIEKEDKIKSLSVELEGYLAGLYYINQIQSYLNKVDDASTRLVEIAKSGYENGVMLVSEYNSARLKKSEVDMAKVELDVRTSTLEDSVRKTVGTDIALSDIAFTPDEERYETIRNMERSELRLRAVSSSNSAIRMANEAIVAAEYGEKIVNGSMYGVPDLALNVSLGYGGSRFPFIESNWMRKDDYTLNFTIALQTTLWDGGKILNNKKRTQSQIETQKLTLESAKTELSIALEENFRNMDLAKARIDYYESKRVVLQDEMETLQKQRDAGYTTESDLLQKEIEINQNEISILEEKANLMQGALAVEYITGLR